MIAIVLLFGFAIGASIGSFLTVVRYRVPQGKSLVTPGSHCDACLRPLRAVENIPVVSWLIQRGRCRTCEAKVPGVYPIIEAACGLAVAGLALGAYLALT
jgi:leader peptidase (prepilin peptidase) / N-methyltransferase